MANIETTGGGKSLSGERGIIRKVIVSTDGTDPSVPAYSQPLSNYSITEEPGGIKRGVFEFATFESGTGSQSGNYQKRVELMGGTREIPIQTHPYFKGMSEYEIAQVETRINQKQDDTWFTTTTDGDAFTAKQQVMYNFLRRGVEYALAPSVVGRVSEFQSSLPSLTPLAKVANPSELQAPSGSFWVCTGISANPVGNRFEVTREYTLTVSTWDDILTLYGWT